MINQSLNSIRNLAIGGVVGEVAFEAYAWLASPTLFGAALQPAKLVMGLTAKYIGIALPYPAAFAIHFLIGSLGFASALWVIRQLTGLSYLVAGGVTGLALWFVAQGILAPMVGRSFMMGFGPYTQSSFIGHVGMTLIMAAIWKWLDTRNPVAQASA